MTKLNTISQNVMESHVEDNVANKRMQTMGKLATIDDLDGLDDDLTVKRSSTFSGMNHKSK